MTSWRRWLRLGFALTIAIALVAFIFRIGPVERDLATRVGERLAAEGQSWASVTATGRDIAIIGTAPSPESAQAALAAAEDVVGVRPVTDRRDLRPSSSPHRS